MARILPREIIHGGDIGCT